MSPTNNKNKIKTNQIKTKQKKPTGNVQRAILALDSIVIVTTFTVV